MLARFPGGNKRGIAGEPSLSVKLLGCPSQNPNLNFGKFVENACDECEFLYSLPLLHGTRNIHELKWLFQLDDFKLLPWNNICFTKHPLKNGCLGEQVLSIAVTKWKSFRFSKA